MITVALSHLLGRGVRLETAEALAIAQLVASSGGGSAIDALVLGSDGGVRCTGQRAVATLTSVAGLLDALLPAEGVPGAVRYAVARALGAAVAPPFATLEEFSRTLCRFESGERGVVIAKLVARGARSATATAVVSSAEPAGDVILDRVPLPIETTPRMRAWHVVVALTLSTVAGFAGATACHQKVRSVAHDVPRISVIDARPIRDAMPQQPVPTDAPLPGILDVVDGGLAEREISTLGRAFPPASRTQRR
ncbi:MAG TPA: hypothetical protein VGI12_20660 [Vicinamibacterales bacterium]|jgi:hypothetical protein